MTTADLITHSGERGRAREEILRQFLAEIVPTGFDVATGFVIDSNGQQSRQQDLIIVRRDYHPSFQVGGAQFFPVEAVAATIEVKSTLTSQTLLDAIENVKSVKRLDRSAGGKNSVIVGGAGGGSVEGAWGDKDRTELKSFIVAARSAVQWETACRTFEDAVRAEPRSVWPNSLTAADSFYLAYKGPAPAPRTDVHVAVEMALYLPSEETNVEPLVDLAGDLWSWLRVVPLIDVTPLLYVPTSNMHKLKPMPDFKV